MVATNCAQAAAAFVGTDFAQDCNAAANVDDAPHPVPLPIGWGEGVRRTGEGTLESLTDLLSPSHLPFAEKIFQIFSAPFAAMPGSNWTSRLKDTSSRGLATSFRNAVASLMCACSKNRMPLVMEKGMCRL